jgi:hypothetical protein
VRSNEDENFSLQENPANVETVVNAEKGAVFYGHALENE